MPFIDIVAEDIVRGVAPDYLINSLYAGEGDVNAAKLQITGNVDLPALVNELNTTGLQSYVEPYLEFINSTGFMGFLLTRANESFSELYSVKEMQGESFSSRFQGNRAPIFSYEAILLETDLCPWKTIFEMLYLYYMRGSQAAKYDLTVVLTYGGSRVTGVMLDAEFSQSSEMQMAPNCSFKILVESFTPIIPGADYLPSGYDKSKLISPTTGEEGSGGVTSLTGKV